MPFVENMETTVAAATAVLGYDLLSGNRDSRSTVARTIVGLWCTGSAAAGDTIFDLYVDGQRKGTYRNTATGLTPDMDHDYIALETYVPPNALIEAIVTDAASTNPVVTHLEFAKAGSTSTGRRYGTRRNYGTRRTSSAPRRGNSGRRFASPGGMYQ